MPKDCPNTGVASPRRSLAGGRDHRSSRDGLPPMRSAGRLSPPPWPPDRAAVALPACGAIHRRYSVGDESAQFGGRSENQLRPGIDVEWQVEAVPVDAEIVPLGAALIK